MKFLIPALIGAGVAVVVNRMIINRIGESTSIAEIEDGTRVLEAYGALTGALAGIGALAVIRKFRR